MNWMLKLAMLPTAIRIRMLRLRGKLYGIKAMWPVWRWQFTHSAFKWVQDEDGDIGIRILWVLTLIKYKQSTMWHWFKRMPEAPKRVAGIDSGSWAKE
jgi:hypothetical protein